jgi:hypothetical protein
MWWAAAVQTGMSLFGAMSQSGAAKDARQIGGMNANAQREETAEELRRAKLADAYQEGTTQTIQGASGFSMQKGTSQGAYLSEMVSENRRQREFTKKSGKRKAAILNKGGQLAYKEGKARAMGGLADAVGSFGSMATSLWGGDE